MYDVLLLVVVVVLKAEGELPTVAALEKGVDYGLLTGDCLGNLEMVLREVRAHTLHIHLCAVTSSIVSID